MYSAETAWNLKRWWAYCDYLVGNFSQCSAKSWHACPCTTWSDSTGRLEWSGMPGDLLLAQNMWVHYYIWPLYARSCWLTYWESSVLLCNAGSAPPVPCPTEQRGITEQQGIWSRVSRCRTGTFIGYNDNPLEEAYELGSIVRVSCPHLQKIINERIESC